MKMFLISDNLDTKNGMRLAGVNGVIVHGKEATLEALDNAVKDKTIGIIIITEGLANLIPGIISQIKLNKARPLIVEVPDRHGTKRGPNHLLSGVNEAIGIKL